MDPVSPSPPPPPPPLAAATATATEEAPPPENLENITRIPPESDESRNDQIKNQQEAPGMAKANFKAFVMAIAASDPKRPLTPRLKTLIHDRFNNFFRDCHTPDHPPYAAMIITALKELREASSKKKKKELREAGGSSEESISKFIQSKYDDLPCAHSTFLKLHLWKLCESGDIHVTSEKGYLLGGTFTKLSPGQNTGGRSERKKSEEKWDRPCMEDTINEENKPKEEEKARSKIDIHVTETKGWWVSEEHNQPAGEYNEVILEQDRVEEEKDEEAKVQNQTSILNDAIGYGGCAENAREQKVCTGVIEKQLNEVQNDGREGKTVSKGQQIEVIKGKRKYLEQQIEVITEQDRVVKGLPWSQIHEQQQQEQEKPQHKKLVIRLQPPIPASASVANISESLPLDHFHDQLPACIEILSPTNQQCQNEQQQPVKRRRGRLPKPKPEAVENKGVQQKHRARARPPKCKSSAGQPEKRRRGRPPKLRLEADKTTGLLLNSSFQHNPPPQMQQGENLALGRTPMCKAPAGRDVEIHKSSSNSSVQVGEGHERWTQGSKDGIMVSISEETQSQSAIVVPPSEG